MKIFNWVHKRFHHNNLKDGFASNMKKSEPTINNVDSTQALLKQVALTDMLGGWKDGILTIGTLGYDPLSPINNHKEYFAKLGTEDGKLGEGEHDGGDDENCYNAENEELNPLMHNTFEHNFEDDDVIFGANHDANNNYKDDEVVIRTFNEIVLAQPLISTNEIIINMESNDDEEANDDDQKKKKGERITLADLFLADSDVKFKMYPEKVLLESGEKSSLKGKHGMSFAKKLIPRVKDNPHPMKDIKKLMKKMLKRKIHPDFDAKNHKPEGQEIITAGITDDDHNNEIESKASIYCLPI